MAAAVVGLLKDGRPHSIGEIMEKGEIPRDELDMVICFLAKYEIVERVGDYIQLDPDFRSIANVGTSGAHPSKKRVR